MATPAENPAVRPVEGRGPSDSDGVQTWRLRFAQRRIWADMMGYERLCVTPQVLRRYTKGTS